MKYMEYWSYDEVKFKDFPEFAQDFHNCVKKYVRILEMIKDTIKVPLLKM